MNARYVAISGCALAAATAVFKAGSSPELELIYNARRYDKAEQKR